MGSITARKFVKELNNLDSLDKFELADKWLTTLLLSKKRRRNKLGVKVNEKYEITVNTPFLAWEYSDDIFHITRERESFSHSIEVSSKKKKMYEHASSNVNFFMDTAELNSPSGEAVSDRGYSCPNCGNVSTVAKLSSTGCETCGTRFSIPDLYPKVTSCNYQETAIDDTVSGLNQAYKVAGIILAICVSISMLIYLTQLPAYIKGGQFLMLTIVFWLVALFLSAIPALMGLAITYNIYDVGNLFKNYGSRQTNRQNDKINEASAENFEKAMQKHSPMFNYQFFCSHIYNQLGTIIFAESLEECPFYFGQDIIGKFNQIIDFNPQSVWVKNFRVNEERVVTIECYVKANILALSGAGKVVSKTGKYTMHVCKNLNAPMDYMFSIYAYKCAGCGATYDVTKSAICPYCGRHHDVQDQDWYIASIDEVTYE